MKMNSQHMKQEEDDYIDILALRKLANYTPPPGLSLGLNKINPRYADFIVPNLKKAMTPPMSSNINNQAQQGKELQEIFDEFSELTEQMKSYTLTGESSLQNSQVLEPQPKPPQVIKPKVILIKPIETNLPQIHEQHERSNQMSRQIQNEYQYASLEGKNLIFEEKIRAKIVVYATDKYDHFILEKVLDVGPLGHKQWIFEKIYELRETFSQDQYASKVFQKCIEVSAKESKSHFVLYAQYILDHQMNQKILYVDKIGSQIIQKSLDVFDGEYLYQLILNLQRNIVTTEILDEPADPNDIKRQFDLELCTNQFGCLIVNKIIEIYPKQIEIKNKQLINKIIERVINASSCLSRRQYSNYIIQQILEKGQTHHKKQLLDNHILRDFVSMSMDKYGSNVTEKAIIFGGHQWRTIVWEEEISIADHVFKNLINDHYANYVMQKVYDYITYEQKQKFQLMLNALNKKSQLNTHGNIVLKYVEQKQRENVPIYDQIYNQYYFNVMQGDNAALPYQYNYQINGQMQDQFQQANEYSQFQGYPYYYHGSQQAMKKLKKKSK